jgi:transposase-like protein
MINFTGRHFPKDIILMSVRWYLSYSLSYRDIEELMQERMINVDHATLQRWVVKYSSQLLIEFNKKKRQISSSWRMDESVLLQAA